MPLPYYLGIVLELRLTRTFVLIVTHDGRLNNAFQPMP